MASSRPSNGASPQRKPAVLVVGQTPPPYGGQALMIESIVNADFERISVHHVRMAFSPSMKSMGRFQAAKMAHLLSVVAKSLWARFRYGTRVLYFSPAGPNWVPVIRDIVLLTAIRPFFEKTVFHFNAAGVSDFLRSKDGLLKRLALRAYSRPEGAIQISPLNPDDPEFFGARRTQIIPNGLEDAAPALAAAPRPSRERIAILFVGVVSEGKGVKVLLQAARILRERGVAFTLSLMGEFSSPEFEAEARGYLREGGLEERIDFLGERTGADKWRFFAEADLFCFPSHFESESFGNVVLEAMMFRLPVVATRWRGIPGVVEDGRTGILVPTRDPERLAEALETLARDEGKRREMGERGRERYLREFTLEKHLGRVEDFLYEVSVAR